MLCPKCDEYRFGKFETKPGTRSAKKAQANKHSIAVSTPSTTVTTTTVNTADNKKADAPSRSEVETLREEVILLRASVASLEAKVSYLLSFVGAVDCEPTPTLVQTPADDNWTTVGPNGHPVKSSTTSTSASAITNGSVTVTAAKSSSKVLQSSDRLRQDIVAAVYVDMHEKKRRANNVILSGLPPSDSTDDRTLVSQLLETELQSKPGIRGCKRLGLNSTGDRPRPIQITLENQDDADYLLHHARLLRRSSSQEICDNVYINPDLTRAEAKAAYELRCRRREAREKLKKPQLNPAAQTFQSSTTDDPPHSANA